MKSIQKALIPCKWYLFHAFPRFLKSKNAHSKHAWLAHGVSSSGASGPVWRELDVEKEEKELVLDWQNARKNKDFEKADLLRIKINELGIRL